MTKEAFQPRTISDLKNILNQSDAPVFIGGGTDLVVRMNRKPLDNVTLVDLSHVEALDVIEKREDHLFVGAMSTMNKLSGSDVIRKETHILASAADVVGSTQIRNRATIGGNVANAAQCSDTVPALIALDASVVLMDRFGNLRNLKVEAFILGIGKTRLGENEVITGFQIPASRLRFSGGFAKIGSREKVTIAKLNGAVSLKVEDGYVNQVRVALGSLGQRAFYAETLSDKLEHFPVSALLSEEVLQWFVSQVDQAIPGRASQPYKRSAVKALAFSMLEQTILENSR